LPGKIDTQVRGENMRNMLGTLLFILVSCAAASGAEPDSGKGRLSVPFSISRTGHIVIKADIKGKDAYFVVDTAAGASVINQKSIRYLGLKPGATVRGGAKGLGTSSHATRQIAMPGITIQKVEYKNPYFVTMDLSHAEQASEKGLHGLIGSPFLQKHGAIINYEQKTISLRLPK